MLAQPYTFRSDETLKNSGIQSHTPTKQKFDSNPRQQIQNGPSHSSRSSNYIPISQTNKIYPDQHINQQQNINHQNPIIHDDKEMLMHKKISYLLSEVDKLNQYSIQKSEELEKWRFQCLSLESKMSLLQHNEQNAFQINHLEGQLSFYLNKNKENEIQIQTLNDQNQRLNLLNETKIEENDILRSKILRLEGQMQEVHNFQIENVRLKEIINTQSIEIQEMLGDKRKQSITDLEMKDLQLENYRLKTILGEERENVRELLIKDRHKYDQQIQLLLQKIQEIENEYNQNQIRFDQNMKELRFMQEDKLQMQRLLKLREEEIEDYKVNYQKLEKIIQDSRGHQNQNIQILAEVERLNHQIQIKDDENLKWKEQFRAQKQHYDEQRYQQFDSTHYQNEIMSLKNQIEHMKQFEYETNRLRIENQQNKEYHITQTKTFQHQCIENEQLKQKILNLEKINIGHGEQGNQIRYDSDSKHKHNLEISQANFHQLERQYANLLIEKDEIKRSNLSDPKVAQASIEIEKLQGIIRSRLQEIEQWRYKYVQLESQGSDLQAYKEKISVLEAEIHSWKQRANSVHVNSSQQDEIFRLNQIIEDLRRKNH